MGGESSDRSKHPLPENLSCDAYKNHLITQNKLPTTCEGYLLNPLNMLAFPCLFTLDRRTGELKPDVERCAAVIFIDNHYPSTAELVQKTIDHLNLNCYRLNEQRLALLHEYNQHIKRARLHNDPQVFAKLATRWFQKRWPSFFTTRRILLGQYAETHLHTLAYNG